MSIYLYMSSITKSDTGQYKTNINICFLCVDLMFIKLLITLLKKCSVDNMACHNDTPLNNMIYYNIIYHNII